jgi:hypothetical protein
MSGSLTKPVPNVGLLPSPDLRGGTVFNQSDEGWGAPGENNFPGPGFKKTFRVRPQTLFDFASKIHDASYYINNIGFGARDNYDDLGKSLVAKADSMFRIMNDHAKVGGVGQALWRFSWRLNPVGWGIMGIRKLQGKSNSVLTPAYNAVSKAIFYDESYFRSGDGFINPLTNPIIVAKLSDPTQYLMIPYDQLGKRRQRPSDKDYGSAPMDTNPGWYAWAQEFYAGVWAKLASF